MYSPFLRDYICELLILVFVVYRTSW